MKKYFLSFFLMSFSILPNAYAIDPPHVVYRADDRNMDEIKESEGMWPKWEDTDMPDDDLIHHFEGESIEGRTSNFVSTTSSIRAAVEHAASLARPNSEEPFDLDFSTFIYAIRPDSSFFDVDRSLASARDAAIDETQRARLTTIINEYTGMEESVAREGFSHRRIMSHAPLTGEMLNYYGVGANSPLFSDLFWENQWDRNRDYNRDYDHDTASAQVYTHVGMPSGSVVQVTNGTQSPVRLGFTCLGVSPDTKKLWLKSSTDTCSAHQYLNIKRNFYDKKLLMIIMMSIDSEKK